MFALDKLLSLTRTGCFTALLLLFCFACNKESNEEESVATDSIQTEASLEAPALLSQYSPKFQKILKSPEGVVRGVTIGDPMSAVRKAEKIAPMEDSTNFVSYNVDLGNNEMTDVLYYFNPQSKTVRNITLDVYLNDPQSVDSLLQEFNQYFTDKYGQPIIREPKAVAWENKKQTKIVLKDVGIPQAPGLRIQIAQGQSESQ